MGKGALLGSLEDTLVMAREIPGVEPCLDFSHLHARSGDGSYNTYEGWVRVFESITTALGAEALQRLHCHLSGIEYGDKGERNHLMLADSDFDLDALLRALHDADCSGRIVCESPEDMDKDALVIKKAWSALAIT
jgi:deoxyribonuclease-4